jgi:hypothetical protein
MSKKNIFQNNNIPSETKDNVAILDEHIKYVLERFPILEEKVNSIQKDNNTLRELVAQLSKKIESFKPNPEFKINQTDCFENLSTDDEPKLKKQEESSTPHVVKEKDTEEWLYFSTPLKGAFNLSAKMKQGDSKICYRINPNTLIIEFIHSSMDSILISYKNEYLSPICDIINSPVSPSSIKMVSPGKVIKQGDGFVINQNNKIKIKLI